MTDHAPTARAIAEDQPLPGMPDQPEDGNVERTIEQTRRDLTARRAGKARELEAQIAAKAEAQRKITALRAEVTRLDSAISGLTPRTRKPKTTDGERKRKDGTDG